MWLLLHFIGFAAAVHVEARDYVEDKRSAMQLTGEGASCAGFLATDPSYPRHYVVHRATTPPTLDGRLDEWEGIPWTEDFVDIAAGPVPRKGTRAKLMWDDSALYVGAWLQEDEIWANLTEHDSVIFHDNDFEVFVDPGASTHYYKEFEVNARAATWDLCLNKPYSNGGYENSSRVFGAKGYEMHPQAAAHIDGTLNDATAANNGWFVEIALPMAGLLVNQSVPAPVVGAYWRLDFSRVEWRVLRQGNTYHKDPAYPAEDNWVWQPIGAINMHMPQRWGIIQFADENVNATKIARDPNWPIRHAAAAVYDTEMLWKDQQGGGKHFTDSIEALLSVATDEDKKLLKGGACAATPTISLNADGTSFHVTVASSDGQHAATIEDNRFFQVVAL